MVGEVKCVKVSIKKGTSERYKCVLTGTNVCRSKTRPEDHTRRKSSHNEQKKILRCLEKLARVEAAAIHLYGIPPLIVAAETIGPCVGVYAPESLGPWRSEFVRAH